MFARHLHKIVDYTRRIVIIPGNHDIKQSNNTIIKDEEKISLGDSIRSIVVAINNPKIVYYDKSGIFKDEVIGLSWVVWSQKNKHSKLQPKPEYNPWIENSIPEGPFIELFHDPVRNAKAFDGKPSKHFENYAITLNDFKANLILANDIHSPDIIWFGENNDIPYIKGNEKHGYNKVVFDLSTNKPVSVDFIPVSNPVSRQTMYLSKDFEYTEEKILLLTKSMKATSSMLIRIIASGNLAGFVETQSIFEKTFKEAFKESIVELYLECTSDIVLEQTVNQEAFEDLEQALDKTKIIDLSKAYIRKLVDSTSTIEKEDKEEAIQYISDLFVEEFNKHSFTQTLNKIDFISFTGNNFMNFGKFNFEIKPAKINRIIGTNGIGKTKIWSFIAWMYID
jgi:DNA repair exonuclease SbcCD nuclease subunit